MDLRTWIEAKVKRNCGRPLLVFEGKEYTYGEFNANVNRAGNALAGLGIGQGDRVGIMLPNIPEHLYTWLGAMKLGAIDVPINPQFKGKLLRDIVDHCDLDAIVIDQEIYQDVCSDVESAGKKIVCVEDSAKKSATSVLDLSGLMAGASAEDPPATGMKGSDIVSFIFTSGTTGLPKAAMLPHGYYIHHAEKWARTMQTSHEDRFFCPLPLYHVVRVTGFLTALASEASFVLGRRFSASAFWDQARSTGFNVFAGHFAIYDMLLSLPEKPDDGDNPVQKVSAILPRSVDAFRQRFRIDRCYNTFGMTEVGFPCLKVVERGVGEDVCGAPGDDFRVKIFDDEDGELPEGEVGEIVVRPEGPDIIFKGYYRQEAKTLEATDNLWFHTGDFGYMKQGELVFTERRSESIRRKGEFVPIAHTEDVLRSHPKVKEAAICGIPSQMDEHVKASIVVREGQQLTPQEMLAYCDQHLPAFAVPRYIEFLDELPRTPGTEKVQRYKLRERGTREAWDSQRR
jgi:carnitine-CoA ligase